MSEPQNPSSEPAPHVCMPRWWEQVELPAARAERRGGRARLPRDLPPVVDAHVHLFPDRVFEAIWRWFDEYGWPIRYKLHTPEQIAASCFSRGVSRVVALHYAHKPGMARSLNHFIAALPGRTRASLGLATVLPRRGGRGEILEEAFALGLTGVKLHCHVQCFCARRARRCTRSTRRARARASRS